MVSVVIGVLNLIAILITSPSCIDSATTGGELALGGGTHNILDDYHELTEQLSLLKSENVTLSQSLSTCVTNASSLMTERELHRAENVQLSVQNTALLAQVQSLTQLVGDFKTNNSELQRKMSKLESANFELKAAARTAEEGHAAATAETGRCRAALVEQRTVSADAEKVCISMPTSIS